MSKRYFSHTLYVAIIEPDPIVSEALVAMLAVHGHRVVCFDTFKAAEAALCRQPFNLILADLTADEASCVTFWQQMCHSCPAQAQRLIFLASCTIRAAIEQALVSEGASLLYKRFTGSRLIAHIHSLLDPQKTLQSTLASRVNKRLAKLPQAA